MRILKILSPVALLTSFSLSTMPNSLHNELNVSILFRCSGIPMKFTHFWWVKTKLSNSGSTESSTYWVRKLCSLAQNSIWVIVFPAHLSYWVESPLYYYRSKSALVLLPTQRFSLSSTGTLPKSIGPSTANLGDTTFWFVGGKSVRLVALAAGVCISFIWNLVILHRAKPSFCHPPCATALGQQRNFLPVLKFFDRTRTAIKVPPWFFLRVIYIFSSYLCRGNKKK